MKKTLFAMLLTLACLSGTQGQRFEWAKGYGSREGAVIKGSVADSEGNLYILGEFRGGDTWDGQPLLPITPAGPYNGTINVLIAKISPSGEMLWKKVIHANNGQNSLGYDIKKVGDTAFACLVDISLPTSDNYLYFLDTLIPGLSDYPFPGSLHHGFTWGAAFLMFDFEGNLQDKHFLQVSFLDADGNDFMFPPQTLSDTMYSYICFGLHDPSFDIDSRGNIYLSRRPADEIWWDETLENMNMVQYSTLNGGVSAIKFWVDRRVAGITYIDGTPNPGLESTHLLKFAPHFDTLLDHRFVVQHSTGRGSLQSYIRMDKYDNLYVVGSIQNSYGDSATFVIDSVQNISITATEAHYYKDCLVKFDSHLRALYCVSLEDSVIHPGKHSHTEFMDVAFDYDSNLLFIGAHSGRGTISDTVNYYSILMYRGTPLSKLKSGAFFLAIHIQTGDFASYGYIPSVMGSNMVSNSHYNIACGNNRVFLQSRYMGGLRHEQHGIVFSNRYDESLGLQIFDYNGTLLTPIHYYTSGPNNKVGSITLTDSVLYLSNLLTSSATFGNIQVPAQGHFACIAKYVDTAFMTPYVAPATPTNIPIAEGTAGSTIYPNPATDLLHIDTAGEPLSEAAIVSVLGQRIPAPVSGNTVDISQLQQGIYLLEITTKEHKSYIKFIKL